MINGFTRVIITNVTSNMAIYRIKYEGKHSLFHVSTIREEFVMAGRRKDVNEFARKNIRKSEESFRTEQIKFAKIL